MNGDSVHLYARITSTKGHVITRPKRPIGAWHVGVGIDTSSLAA